MLLAALMMPALARIVALCDWLTPLADALTYMIASAWIIEDWVLYLMRLIAGFSGNIEWVCIGAEGLP